MKLLLLIIPLFAAALCESNRITDAKNCKCDTGFEARGDPENGFKCFGLLLRIIVPCNLVKNPPCKCTAATGILVDNTGTWCSSYGGGREIRRWHCENKEEWDEFYEKHPKEVQLSL